VLLAVVVCITGLAASILVAKVLRLDPGFAAGLMSGALTASAAMGTATTRSTDWLCPRRTAHCLLRTSPWRMLSDIRRDRQRPRQVERL
jgi:uncharacterized transporter YbjL